MRTSAPLCLPRRHCTDGRRPLACAFALIKLPAAIISASGLVFVEPHGLVAQEFEVEGTIHSQPDFKEAGMEPATHFTFSAKGCNWLMRLTGDTQRVYDYHEISYDGENLYFLTSIQSMINERRRKGQAVGSNVATGWILKGPILRSVHAPEVGPIWLTYASRCYFDEVKGNLVEQVLAHNCPPVLDPTVRVKLQPASWNRFKEFPYFLSQAMYFDDGSPSWLDERGNPLIMKQKDSNTPIGLTTNLSFLVTGVSNVNGSSVPVSAELEVFCRRGSSADIIRASRYDIRALRILSTVSISSFQPKLPGLTLVTDARLFDRAGNLSYKLQKKWLPEAEARNGLQFQRGMGDGRGQTVGGVRPLL